jgi:hypothetical protein
MDFKTRRVAAFRKNLIELAELELKHAKVKILLHHSKRLQPFRRVISFPFVFTGSGATIQELLGEPAEGGRMITTCHNQEGWSTAYTAAVSTDPIAGHEC